MATATCKELVGLIEKLLVRQQLNLWEFSDSDEDLCQLILDLKLKKFDSKNASKIRLNYATMDKRALNYTRISDEKSNHILNLIETAINRQHLKLYELIDSKIELKNQIEDLKEHHRLMDTEMKCENNRNTDLIDTGTDNWVNNEMVHMICEIDPSINDNLTNKSKIKCKLKYGETSLSRGRKDGLRQQKLEIKLNDHRHLNCNICGKRASTKSNLLKHMLLHTNKEKIVCSECNRQFVRNDYLVAHKKRCHYNKDRNKFPCTVCARAFNSAMSLQKHLLTHNDATRTFECIECKLTFKNELNLQDHMNRHSGAKPYSCDICDAKFAAHLLIKRHMIIHSGLKSNLCNVCGSAFKRMKDLKYHMFRHTGDSTYQCNECKKNFFSKYYLEKHMLVHTGVKEFECHICGYKCSAQNRLNVHVRTHGPKIQIPCTECGQIFENMRSLEKHLIKHTAGFGQLAIDKPFECGECPRKFYTKINLNKHIEKIHSEDSKRFTCPICKATLASAKGLRSHQNTHTKPFRCHFCAKTFGHSGNLNSHLMTHTGEKPINCNICGKAFRTTSTMVTHRRIHTRDKTL